ncbi:MAG: DUF2817 domain-containing protein [Phycisphaeraceae bacterium]|nr:DUF2817 domain-containing protein [Phycisphaeraceae bacterium]
MGESRAGVSAACRRGRACAAGLLCVIALGMGMGMGMGGCAGKKREADELKAAELSDSDVWRTIGFSVSGRSIEAITVGGGSWRVLVVGGIHGDEREALPSIGRLTEQLSREPAAGAATWRVIRDLNPDGSALERRGNSRNVDLNRNFPARNFEKRDRHGDKPFSEPEAELLASVVRFDQPDLIVVFHSTLHGPFVNFDGPAVGYARAFADGAAGVDPRWRIVPEMSYATPGSLGSYFGQDQGIPVLTIEFKRYQDVSEVWRAIEMGFASLARHLVSARIEEGLR